MLFCTLLNETVVIQSYKGNDITSDLLRAPEKPVVQM